MDAMTYGTYYLIKRLNLHINPRRVKHELEILFSASNGKPALQSLLLKFNEQKYLIPSLGSWLYGSDHEKLKLSDTLVLLGKNEIQNMAIRIWAKPQELSIALAELIPTLINKASNNGELCKAS